MFYTNSFNASNLKSIFFYNTQSYTFRIYVYARLTDRRPVAASSHAGVRELTIDRWADSSLT